MLCLKSAYGYKQTYKVETSIIESATIQLVRPFFAAHGDAGVRWKSQGYPVDSERLS